MNMRLCLPTSLAHSVTGDTILWNAVPEYVTDGLKVCLQGAVLNPKMLTLNYLACFHGRHLRACLLVST